MFSTVKGNIKAHYERINEIFFDTPADEMNKLAVSVDSNGWVDPNDFKVSIHTSLHSIGDSFLVLKDGDLCDALDAGPDKFSEIVYHKIKEIVKQ